MPAPGQVLVAVERTGICGTDLEEYLHGPVAIPAATAHPLSGRRAPITLGHEVVGTVASCPGGELPAGARVVPDVVVGCGGCWFCARHEEGLCTMLSVRGLTDDGGLADFMLADAATCIVVPDHVSADVAAFAEPAAVAVRAVRKAGDLAGATACVVGAGTIGLLVMQALRAHAVEQVIAVDPVASRRALARSLGAVAAAPADALAVVWDLTRARGADVVLECSGADAAVVSALRVSRAGGTIVLVGTGKETIPLPVRELVLGERRVLGSAAHLWDEDVAGAVGLLARGTIDPLPLLTEVVRLDDVVASGFERLRDDRDALKILIAPGAA